MEIQIPHSKKKRVVIIGGGFGGLTLAKKLDNKIFQIVLIDKCNYHQFPPLLYQVASSGLEPGSISFPFRKQLGKRKDIFFRLAEVTSISTEDNCIRTNIGTLSYDYLVIGAGTTTNYYGNEAVKANALPMKTVEEALELKNAILVNLEKALDCTDLVEKQSLLNIVIVGGGATGVEIAGAISEMKRYVLRKDYPDLANSHMNVYLIEGTNRLLGPMTEESSRHALTFLQDMGVKVILNKKVTGYEDHKVIFDDGEFILTETLIWVSGVTAQHIDGLPDNVIGHAGRIIVNEFNEVKAVSNIFAIGDICLQEEEAYPKGHPQVAPVAIQQGKLLAKNLKRLQTGEQLTPFHYHNQGTLATVGRNKAVADLHKIRLHGFPAWAVWMLVHLRSILGVRNKLTVLFDWVWNYFTYDQSMRFIVFIRPRKK